MNTPTRSIDRKLEAVQKRIEAERATKPMTRPPSEGLTSAITGARDSFMKQLQKSQHKPGMP